MSLDRETFRRSIDAKIDCLQEEVAAGLERIIRDQLRVWSERYPNRTFRAAVGHGMLILDMKPRAFGVEDPRYLPDKFLISHEAEELVDFFNDFDRINIGLGSMDWMTPEGD